MHKYLPFSESLSISVTIIVKSYLLHIRVFYSYIMSEVAEQVPEQEDQEESEDEVSNVIIQTE